MSVSIRFALPQQTVCFIGELLIPWNAHMGTDLVWSPSVGGSG